MDAAIMPPNKAAMNSMETTAYVLLQKLYGIEGVGI
jgi:hypothetical protein